LIGEEIMSIDIDTLQNIFVETTQDQLIAAGIQPLAAIRIAEELGICLLTELEEEFGSLDEED
jgi:hypothetical protein